MKTRMGIYIAALLMSSSYSTLAEAQESSEAKESDAPAEIVVTAQRFEQRLQDVPISITAVSSEDLQSRGVSSLSDMQYAVPGLSSFEYGPGYQFLQMRGLSNALGSPTVGVYIDELPVTLIGQGPNLDVRTIDLERIEVLRGPQATLYGENSMGGTIRYITASPDLTKFGAGFDGSYGGTKDGNAAYSASAMVNIPIVNDKLGLRVSGGYERLGGYIDGPLGDDINTTNIKTLRAKILAKPSDQFTLQFMYQHQESEQENQNFGVNRITTATVPTPNNQNYDILQATATLDLNSVILSATGGYIDFESFSQNDVSPFFVPALTAPPPFGFGLPLGFITQVGLPSDSNSTVKYGELRAASAGKQALYWNIGATYRDLKYGITTNAFTSPGALPFAILDLVQFRRSQSFSLYGEVGYHLTEKLLATVGLRYFEDQQELVSDSTNFGFQSLDNGKGSFNALNPRFNVQYSFSDESTVYANASKGFRSGGFNLTSAGFGVFPIEPAYQPDKIWTYEFGTKQQAFDRKLAIEAAVYYTKWQDVQSSNFAPGSSIIIVSNSGDVAGWGVDLSATANPFEGFTLSGTYSWNNLEFKTATADKAIGDPVDYAIQETYSASADYRFPISERLTGFVRGDYQHAGRGQITLRNFGGQVVDRPSRDVVNLRAGLEVGIAQFAIFANNVFDEDAPNIVGPFGVLLENLEQQPRVIGASISVRF